MGNGPDMKHPYSIAVPIIVAGLVYWPAVVCSEPVPLCSALYGFMEAVFRAASFDEDARSRVASYNAATEELMKVAKVQLGPSADASLFRRHVLDYVRHQETYRRPPPGWIPKGSTENLLLFSDIAKRGLRVDLNLLGWCER